jgi:hypothetical protein
LFYYGPDDPVLGQADRKVEFAKWREIDIRVFAYNL